MLSLSFTEDYNIVTDIDCSWYDSDLFPNLKLFRANSLKTPLFSQKNDYLRKEHRNTQKFCFS